MAVDKLDFVQRTIFAYGEYEPEVTQWLLSEFTRDDVFYDVGANVGYYSCAALTKGVRSVYAFEPDPLSASVLRLNLRLNHIIEDERCKVMEMALSSRNGTQTFYRSNVSNTGRSGFRPRDPVASFAVNIESIDTIVAKEMAAKPSIMKIDVEGFEYDVLLGARRLLEETPPRLIIFEGPNDLLAFRSEHPMTMYLERYGYTVEHLARASGQVEEVENYAARLSTTKKT